MPGEKSTLLNGANNGGGGGAGGGGGTCNWILRWLSSFFSGNNGARRNGGSSKNKDDPLFDLVLSAGGVDAAVEGGGAIGAELSKRPAAVRAYNAVYYY